MVGVWTEYDKDVLYWYCFNYPFQLFVKLLHFVIFVNVNSGDNVMLMEISLTEMGVQLMTAATTLRRGLSTRCMTRRSSIVFFCRR